MLITADTTYGDATTYAGTHLQSLLDLTSSNGGGVVEVPGGTYLNAQRLEIDSNTLLLLDPDARILRSGPGWGIQSKPKPSIGGFDQCHDIEITGGVWDGNRDEFDGAAANANTMTFRHCTDVKVDSVTLEHIGGAYHPIEFNAVKGGRVKGSIIRDYPGLSDPNRVGLAEAIQIDLAFGSAPTTHSPVDNTPCLDILIEDVAFEGIDRGIGSHSQRAGFQASDIKIVNCRFSDVTGECIAPLNWSNVKITGNSAFGVESFVMCETPVDLSRDYTLTGNSVENEFALPLGAGMWFRGGSVAARRFLDIIIGNNRLAGLGRFGIVLDYVSSFAIGENIVRDTARAVQAGVSSAGISVYRSGYGSVSDNRLNANGDADIVLGAKSGGVTGDTPSVMVHDNRTQRIAIGLSDGCNIHDNVISTELAYFGGQSNMKMHDNQIRGLWS